MRMTVNTAIKISGVVAAWMVAGLALAQAPASAPAGSTGLCKDGTYSQAAKKQGACRGHNGVKEWYAAASGAAASAPAAAAKPAPAAAPASAPTPEAAAPKASAAPKAPAASTAKAAAPGGGPGQVWVNTATKVYHCPGDRYYGKTKAGSYMSEADAKAGGNRPDHNKACSQ
jgi:hypothetical protein